MNNHMFLEEVCAKCPGSQWEKSAMCRIHDMHIGKVQSCPQWEGHQVAQEEVYQEQQLAWCELEPALEAIQRVEQDLRDYHWMVKEIQDIQDWDKHQKQYPREVWESLLGAGTAQYGIEASLPKAKGVNSDATYREAQKLLRKWERMKRYEHKVKKLEASVATLQDERERSSGRFEDVRNRSAA